MILCLILIICSLILISPTFIVEADCNFARIASNDVYLYSTTNTSSSNIVCQVENSYFVLILASYYDDFYRVEYNNLEGYVLKDKVIKVDGTPLNPYPSNITLTTISNVCNLRSSPYIKTTPTNVLCSIPSNTNNIQFLGKVYGDNVFDYSNNLWYLVKYNETTGYIYNGYIKSQPAVYPNVETLSITGIEQFVQNPLSNPACAILIMMISLPCVIIMYIIFSKKEPKSKNHLTHKSIKEEKY